MTIIAVFNEYIDDASKAAGSVAGLVVAVVIASEKIARCIPTNFKNKTIQRVARIAYGFFAILGLKAPDIVQIKDGKIVTNAEAIAQSVVDNKEVESK